MIINIYYRPIIQTVNIGNNNNGNVSQATDGDGQSTGRPEYPAMLEQAQETAAEIAAIKAETAKFRAMAEAEKGKASQSRKTAKKGQTEGIK